ncbi:ATP-binding protein [Desulfobacterales bacterium HSG2]|nr:ATP-binding protein [Desulfobacterales bacterium HSG2]
MIKLLSFLRPGKQSRLSYRLLLYVVLCSSFFTLLATAFQLYLSYQKDMAHIHESMEFIRKSYVLPVARSTYYVDEEQSGLLLKGALKLQDIRYVYVTEPGSGKEPRVREGDPNAERDIVREFPLKVYDLLGKITDMGTLTVVASLEDVYQRLLDRALVILVSNAIKTFLASLCILLIIHFLITRHLTAMADYTRQLDMNRLDRELVLDRGNTKSSESDELEQLVTSVNDMRIRLIQGIAESEQARADLKKYSEHLEEMVEERTVKLREAKESAEAANRTKSEFLSNMSHELRTPLNAVLGFAQLLTHSRNLTPDEREDLDLIMRSGEHLLTLINQLLDLSKIEAGRMTLNEKNFDLHGLLDDITDMFRLRADEKRLQFLFERFPDLPRYVRTDEVKLRQVLINLLNNAFKFTEEGGVAVRVGVADSEDSGSEIRNLKFEIEDTGPGIAPDESDSLFESFVQTKTGLELQEGSGLGLPISRNFVRLMGGELAFRSEVDRGTLFSFNIRGGAVHAADVPTAQPTSRVIGLEPDQPRYRILIVDDKWENRHLMMKLLRPLGFELREAANGQEAIETWERWDPHLIWMDMRMPVTDGYKATERIKATTKGQATAVIALTASAFDEEKAVVLSAGCDDFLRKPFKEAEIFDLMHKHLGVRYVYEEIRKPEPRRRKPKPEDVLTPEALAALPDDVLAGLQKAAEIADFGTAKRLIGQIGGQNKSLADAFSELVNDYQFDILISVFENK